VVIGKPNTQTAVFSDEMEEIVFNPYWNVPTSIKANEIAPYLQTGGGFFGGGWDTSVLRRHNLRIRGHSGRDIDPDSVDWSRVDVRTLELYQPPGPGNVLGTMKFVFPNKHDIYMHDTTQKHLFTNAVRTESHGCVRVQNPDRFAQLLLKRDQGWSPVNVTAAVQGRDDNHIALQQKVPVHMSYFTVTVDEDGSLSTFRDLYGHDARMIAALNGSPMAYEQPAPEIVAIEGRPRGRARKRDFSSDFTRTLFGF
jgi:murein L,D-transpeptidase YcbB/YkuD